MRAEYKNTIATKRKLMMTYLRLLAERGEDFSVTDIVSYSKINRGTFYLHYKSKNELGKAILTELASKINAIENLPRTLDIDRAPEIVLNKLNLIIKNDLEFFKLVANASNNERFYELIKKGILNIINNNFQVMKYIFSMERFNTVCSYIVGGILSVYKDWFSKKFSCTLEELTTTISSLIRLGLKGSLRYED